MSIDYFLYILYVWEQTQKMHIDVDVKKLKHALTKKR